MTSSGAKTSVSGPGLTIDHLMGLYKSIGETEAHFNRIQAQYRLLSSTWLLASVGACGFVLAESVNLAVHPTIIAGFICGAATVGTLLIWFIDMRVYQRLLSANYLEGLAMEHASSNFPQIRTRIRADFRFWLPIMLSLFYLGQAALLWVLSCVLLLVDWKGGSTDDWSTALAIAVIGVLVIAAVTLSGDLPDKRRKNEDQGPDRSGDYKRLLHEIAQTPQDRQE